MSDQFIPYMVVAWDMPLRRIGEKWVWHWPATSEEERQDRRRYERMMDQGLMTYKDWVEIDRDGELKTMDVMPPPYWVVIFSAESSRRDAPRCLVDGVDSWNTRSAAQKAADQLNREILDEFPESA